MKVSELASSLLLEAAIKEVESQAKQQETELNQYQQQTLRVYG
jgi:hypothetical protein